MNKTFKTVAVVVLSLLIAVAALTFVSCKKDEEPQSTNKITYSDGTYYEGDIVDGVAQGNGVLYSADGKVVYTGSFANDKFDGQGVLTTDKGVYTGAFSAGKKSGQGTMVYADGLTFEGTWERDNRADGKLQLSADGEYYQGKFLYGEMYGQGTLCTKGTNSVSGNLDTYNVYVGGVDGLKKSGTGVFTANGEDKTVYSGKFVNDELTDENAVITYAEDSDYEKYEGGFAGGAFSGYGKLTYKNGEVKEGYWKDGKCDMSFVNKIDFNGCKYSGYVDENNVPNGQGTIYYPDGSVRTGNWTKGVMNGYGEHTYPNTMTYKGNFVNNQYDGYGVFNWNTYDEFGGLLSPGWRYEGEFKNGTMVGCIGTVYFNQAEVGDGVYYFKGEMDAFPGVKRGQVGEGKIVYRDGTYYIGSIKYDENGIWTRYGKGTMYFQGLMEGSVVGVQDGSVLTYYVGEFDESHSGWMFGNGCFYLSNFGAPSGYITGYWGGTARLGEYFDEENPWSTDLLLDEWKGTNEYVYENKVTPPAGYKDVDVLFVGDSYFDFWRDSRGSDTGGTYLTDTAGINCENVGIGGTRFDQWIDYFDVLVKGFNPKKVVIHLGTNDLNVGKSLQKTMEDMKTLTQLIHEQLPQTEVYVLTYEPTLLFDNRWNEVGKEYNEQLKAYAEGVDYLTVIDTAAEFTDSVTGKVKSGYNSSDGLHLSNTLGYPAFWKVIKEAIGY